MAGHRSVVRHLASEPGKSFRNDRCRLSARGAPSRLARPPGEPDCWSNGAIQSQVGQRRRAETNSPTHSLSTDATPRLRSCRTPDLPCTASRAPAGNLAWDRCADGSGFGPDEPEHRTQPVNDDAARHSKSWPLSPGMRCRPDIAGGRRSLAPEHERSAPTSSRPVKGKLVVVDILDTRGATARRRAAPMRSRAGRWWPPARKPRGDHHGSVVRYRLLNFRTMLSASPIAAYCARSTEPSAKLGGRVHTPLG